MHIELMPTISKVFTTLCLFCLCGIIGNTIHWQLRKQISKRFFQMSAWLYSVLVQTEGKGKFFVEWATIYLSPKLSLTHGGNVNFYKSIHYFIPNLYFQNKSVSSPFNWVSRYILFLAKVKGKGRPSLRV